MSKERRRAARPSAPCDADVGVVDVVLGVVRTQQLLVLVHAEGDQLVDALLAKMSLHGKNQQGHVCTNEMTQYASCNMLAVAL